MNALVEVIDGTEWTTTRIIAARFGKQHKSVLRAIELNECSPTFRQRNFAPTFYVDAQGKSQPMSRITRDGFAMIAMGFTGKTAVEWKEKFIDAFNHLAGQNASGWLQSRNQGKAIRGMTTDIIAEFIQYAFGQGSESAEMYYVHFSKMVNSNLLVIEGKKPSNLRDQLNILQLHQVSVAEGIISKSIAESMTLGHFYKDAYQKAKEKVASFANTIGRSKLGATERQTLGLLEVRA